MTEVQHGIVYSAGRRSLVFHRVRTVSIDNDLDVSYMVSMVGHGRLHRLFVLGVTDQHAYIIFRIDPVSGIIELYWLVDDDLQDLAVAGDKLLVTTFHYLHEYNVDGQLLRAFATDLSDYTWLWQSSLHTDSIYD